MRIESSKHDGRTKFTKAIDAGTSEDIAWAQWVYPNKKQFVTSSKTALPREEREVENEKGEMQTHAKAESTAWVHAKSEHVSKSGFCIQKSFCWFPKARLHFPRLISTRVLFWLRLGSL
jgi:hypothetical protein